MKGVHDALTRLSGVKTVTVKLQEGVVIATTDPAQAVLPSASWKEIARVGFKPVALEIRARCSIDEGFVVVDGQRWPLSGPATVDKGTRSARLKIRDGAQDPPRVEALE